jgi:hypothetical protein
MFVADVLDEDGDSDTSTTTNPHIQRGSEGPEKGLGGVAPFIERTLEWRRRVLCSHEAGAKVTTSSRQPEQHTAVERRHASQDLKIERIQRHYREQERILENEIVKHEQRYELMMEQLKKEEKDEKDYIAGRWDRIISPQSAAMMGADKALS